MGTKFKEIYDRAIFKFTDYTFLDTISDFKEAVLQKYLLSSIVDFQHACTEVDLTKYDLCKEEFEEELSDEVKEILSLGIAFHWLSAQALTRELLKNRIYSSDYTSFSPANLLKEVQTLRDTVEAEYTGKIKTYSYRFGGIQNLG